jgi:hypothetical protein
MANKTQKHNKHKKSFKHLTKKILPKMTKTQITKHLYSFSLNDITQDFEKLRNLKCDNLNNKSNYGAKFVNNFTAIERLNTKGKRQISFFDFYFNFNDYYNNKYYVRNGIDSVYKGKFLKEKNKEKRINMLKSFYTLYMGNVGIFRPVLAKEIICKYKPKKMLDFTMGWGGRLVGACSENIESYIGIDLNTNLKPHYEKMCKLLNKLSTTKIKLFFKDALKVDYSKLDYDFVLTSPPYYNVEVYNKNNVISIEEWNNSFYTPIFEVTYRYLKKGGVYCLNIPNYIYNDVAIKVLGKCYEKILLGKPKRIQTDTYMEYIYVWKK